MNGDLVCGKADKPGFLTLVCLASPSHSTMPMRRCELLEGVQGPISMFTPFASLVIVSKMRCHALPREIVIVFITRRSSEGPDSHIDGKASDLSGSS